MKRKGVFQAGSADERIIIVSYDLVPRVPPCLTPTEVDVLHLLMAGSSNSEIATERSTSQNTISNQISSIFDKLAVNSRAELALRLHRHCRPCTLSSCASCPSG